jgi:CDP-diacylglycerol pyrophosphatase
MEKEMNSGIVNIRGKEYMTVALRVQNFREAHPYWSIETSIEERTEEVVVMRCAISATRKDSFWRLVMQRNSGSLLRSTLPLP